MSTKLFSTAAVAALTLVAGSALAAPNGDIFAPEPSFDKAAKAGKLSRADVRAQAVQAQHATRSLYANADDATDAVNAVVANAAIPAVRSRADVRAEAVQAERDQREQFSLYGSAEGYAPTVAETPEAMRVGAIGQPNPSY